jgi:hypothetical protein
MSRQLAFVIVAALIGGFVLWLRVSKPSYVADPSGLPFERGSPLLPSSKAAQIAIDEVKKREGWTGEAEPDLEGDTWYVTVRRKRGERAGAKGERAGAKYVTVSRTGHVGEYRDLSSSYP